MIIIAKDIKIATNIEEFQNIIYTGCLICKNKTFKYLSKYNLYKCNKCNSLYATDYKAISKLFKIDNAKTKTKRKNA